MLTHLLQPGGKLRQEPWSHRGWIWALVPLLCRRTCHCCEDNDGVAQELLSHSGVDHHKHTSPRISHQLRNCHWVLTGASIITRQVEIGEQGSIGLNNISLNVSSR